MSDLPANFRRLGPTPLVELLAESIRRDPTLAATAGVLDGLLAKTVKAVPNLLLWARLTPSLGLLSPPMQRLVDFAGGLKPLSDAELELLAWQEHVDFWSPSWPRSVREGLVRESTRWHRIKGTPAGMKMAFALFGLDVSIEEDGEGDYWATYQLGLPQIADLETVKQVCEIAYEMHPARCSLYRIYTDVWDTRPGAYDVGFYDEAAYDYYSGVSVPGLPGGGGVIVSFGRKTLSQSTPSLSLLYVGRERARGVLTQFDEDMSYDVARYDETIAVPNHGFVRSRLNSIVIGRPLYRRHTWTGAWDERNWLDLETVGYVRDHFSFVRRSIAAIEGVYDDSVYDSLNSFYEQPVHTLVDNPPRYDDATYNNHDPGRRVLVVDEIFIGLRKSLGNGSLLPESATGSGKITRAGTRGAQTHPVLPPIATWSGAWDSRVWRAGGAFANTTHKETV